MYDVCLLYLYCNKQLHVNFAIYVKLKSVHFMKEI